MAYDMNYGTTWRLQPGWVLLVFGALMCVNMNDCPVVAAEQTATAGQNVENGAVCSRNEDCLSGSCLVRWGRKHAICECRPCSDAGCGACLTTTYKKCCLVFNVTLSINPTEADAGATARTGIWMQEPTERRMVSEGPSYAPSYYPSEVRSNWPTIGPSYICFDHSDCKQGLVCNTEHQCREKTCWRDRECSEYEAYCNYQMNVCAPKKDAGAPCAHLSECHTQICQQKKCQFPPNGSTLSAWDPSIKHAEARETIIISETNIDKDESDLVPFAPNSSTFGFYAFIFLVAAISLTFLSTALSALLQVCSPPAQRRTEERNGNGYLQQLPTKYVQKSCLWGFLTDRTRRGNFHERTDGPTNRNAVTASRLQSRSDLHRCCPMNGPRSIPRYIYCQDESNKRTDGTETSDMDTSCMWSLFSGSSKYLNRPVTSNVGSDAPLPICKIDLKQSCCGECTKTAPTIVCEHPEAI
mmetsp:Transcript_32936/g.50999  ORF Transcript_32936/g.50999 Transcript_32936/m.50999 type:complete len:469 (+) Transcript_32936:54-1460(+)